MGAYRQALEQLAPGAKISFTSNDENYDTILWKSDTIAKPTRSEVEAKVAEIQPAWNQWDIDRRAAYPSVEEQLDMLWHTMDRGEIPGRGTVWFELIKSVKASTPKPE